MEGCCGDIMSILHSEMLVERLAALEHDRWAHWQSYVHSKCEAREDGSLLIPAELARRWTKQINAAYPDLTEEEKDSDREQVHRYLPLIATALVESQANSSGRQHLH